MSAKQPANENSYSLRLFEEEYENSYAIGKFCDANSAVHGRVGARGNESCRIMLGKSLFCGLVRAQVCRQRAGKLKIESLRSDIQMNLNREREVNTRIRAVNTRIRRAKNVFPQSRATINISALMTVQLHFSAAVAASLSLIARRRSETNDSSVPIPRVNVPHSKRS